MANEGQVEEIEALRLVYEGEDGVIIHLPEMTPGTLDCNQSCNATISPLVVLEASISVELLGPTVLRVCAPADVDVAHAAAPLRRSRSGYHLESPCKFEKLPPLQLSVWLPPEYLAPVDSVCALPHFELSSNWLQHPHLSMLCAQLEQQWYENISSPILFVWLEWLRTESWNYLGMADELVLVPSSANLDLDGDPRAVFKGAELGTDDLDNMLALISWAQQNEQEMQQLAPPSPCANCSCIVLGNEQVCLKTCGHMLCTLYTAATLQVHDVRGATPGCPLPCCRVPIPREVLEQQGGRPQATWQQVLSQVEGTPFQDVVVFCPQCEASGIYIPVLTSTQRAHEGGAAEVYQCQCYRCRLCFCGICRSPCHLGEACLADEARVETMKERRPPLPQFLVEAAEEHAQPVGTVQCPKCEVLGLDILAFTSFASQECMIKAAQTGSCHCECVVCHSEFCGVCRSPCHPGKACMSDDFRVLHMMKRRPPLPPALAERVVAKAKGFELVFCPLCEGRGIDSDAVVLSASISEEAASTGSCHCRCIVCHFEFCGLCRHAYHQGKSCFDDFHVEGMVLRRPPLPSALADLAKAKLEEAKDRLAEARPQALLDSIHALRTAFWSHYQTEILKDLHTIFAGSISVDPAPLSPLVAERFMKGLWEQPEVALLPAFHGTSLRNHKSIFQHGLLIPGQGNRITVANGSAHGLGIYTANVGAAWLSRGFCDKSRMLVCAVLQRPSVRHVMDAMVVFNAAHVVPLFVGKSQGFNPAPRVMSLVTKRPKPVKALELLPVEFLSHVKSHVKNTTSANSISAETTKCETMSAENRGPLGGSARKKQVPKTKLANRRR